MAGTGAHRTTPVDADSGSRTVRILGVTRPPALDPTRATARQNVDGCCRRAGGRGHPMLATGPRVMGARSVWTTVGSNALGSIDLRSLDDEKRNASPARMSQSVASDVSTGA